MRKAEVRLRLETAGIPYTELPVGGGTTALLVQRGGRVLGLYQEEGEENLLWTNPVLEKGEEAQAFLQGTQWNVGGDRLWLGPEIRYSVTDRTRFWETLHTPEAIDPGTYRMEEGPGAIRFCQEMTIPVLDGGSGAACVQVSRRFAACHNPLRDMGQAEMLMEGVTFAGYQQEVCLRGQGTCVEGWSLLQVKAGGRIYIPMYAPSRGVDYYEPARPFEQLLERGVCLEATGENRYKVGYKAAVVTGRIAYSCMWNGRPCLLIRNFPNDPAGIYEEEPPLLPGEKGFSVHVYNDNGNPPSFAEVECSLPAILGGQREESRDVISTWIFTGKKERLEKIGKQLLGMTVSMQLE